MGCKKNCLCESCELNVNVKATLTQVRTCLGSKVACVCIDDDVVSGYKQKAAIVQRNCAMNAKKKYPQKDAYRRCKCHSL